MGQTISFQPVRHGAAAQAGGAPAAGPQGPGPGPAQQSAAMPHAPSLPAAPHVADVLGVVVSHVWLNDEYRHLVLEAPEPAPLAQAGQFFNLECPHTAEDKPFLRRPMSLYRADPAYGRVEFLYKVTGVGTRALASIKVGRTMRLLGPLGVGFSIPETAKDIVVLGRGVGLATLAPLAEMAAARGIGVTAILSARSAAMVMSVERFAAIGARIRVVLDTDGSSDPVNVEMLLRDAAAGGRADAFYTCGSNRLMLLMQRIGRELAIPGEVALEQQMACGLGMCFCCVRNFSVDGAVEARRVCTEGPVFPLDEAMPW
ncbi:dihydroorotate dehydrogenase electron transfer subunit [Rhodoplanes sp. TEM]|uniref:Dihydroorotate dehydrogenase electron transfer subunit n=1 Tax=Rhodoplanes tepidamans TaxID=200616 RepID=A0ABT5J9T3_RHOTP|nr:MULTISPECIES: dihydroorotate dehydrogenase electron transfer subunit [Rhodoplanes]MDC7786171.1 dihydroorotate dehydrogenase electron transfer subunit [Rhodoplanes tepidamans]MDC7982838.1 dihydroorotate dehydrogenase electron transfer subunit [Rhodoplanes sp. TEM]MDQ0357164.1 dihydroorotate dehydrogenase electron transfer subunit [Rhodoplanes tepidamans]